MGIFHSRMSYLGNIEISKSSQDPNKAKISTLAGVKSSDSVIVSNLGRLRDWLEGEFGGSPPMVTSIIGKAPEFFPGGKIPEPDSFWREGVLFNLDHRLVDELNGSTRLRFGIRFGHNGFCLEVCPLRLYEKSTMFLLAFCSVTEGSKLLSNSQLFGITLYVLERIGFTIHARVNLQPYTVFSNGADYCDLLDKTIMRRRLRNWIGFNDIWQESLQHWAEWSMTPQEQQKVCISVSDGQYKHDENGKGYFFWKITLEPREKGQEEAGWESLTNKAANMISNKISYISSISSKTKPRSLTPAAVITVSVSEENSMKLVKQRCDRNISDPCHPSSYLVLAIQCCLESIQEACRDFYLLNVLLTGKILVVFLDNLVSPLKGRVECIPRPPKLFTLNELADQVPDKCREKVCALATLIYTFMSKRPEPFFNAVFKAYWRCFKDQYPERQLFSQLIISDCFIIFSFLFPPEVLHNDNLSLFQKANNEKDGRSLGFSSIGGAPCFQGVFNPSPKSESDSDSEESDLGPVWSESESTKSCSTRPC